MIEITHEFWMKGQYWGSANIPVPYMLSGDKIPENENPFEEIVYINKSPMDTSYIVSGPLKHCFWPTDD